MSSKLNHIRIERTGSIYGDELMITCKTESVSFEESIEAKYASDADVKNGYNAIYFTDALRAIDARSEIKMCYCGGTSPAVFIDDNTKHLVLPVKER